MAQVKIEEIIDHLSHEMKRALEDAVERTIPGVSFDRDELFRQFRKAVYRKCSVWEKVPDQYIQA
jgi:hypothetical protein